MADYDYIATRNQIVQRAFRLIGALGTGQTLSANQLQQGVEALNSMVKSWQNDHIFLWSLVTFSATTAASNEVATITNDENILYIDSAYLIDGDDEIDLDVISEREYRDIVDKQSTGQPTTVAWRASSSELLLYPTPDAIYNINLIAVHKLKDWESASGSGDFPVQFQDAIVYGLANNLADEYGLPIGERQLLERKAQDLYYRARKADRDRSDGEFIRSAY